MLILIYQTKKSLSNLCWGNWGQLYFSFYFFINKKLGRNWGQLYFSFYFFIKLYHLNFARNFELSIILNFYLPKKIFRRFLSVTIVLAISLRVSFRGSKPINTFDFLAAGRCTILDSPIVIIFCLGMLNS